MDASELGSAVYMALRDARNYDPRDWRERFRWEAAARLLAAQYTGPERVGRESFAEYAIRGADALIAELERTRKEAK
jgi:hypothetical protein